MNTTTEKNTKNIPAQCLSSFVLKMIAMITMLIDHIGAILQSENATPFTDATYHILRSIGRISFPIFCYLLADGFFYTKNKKKYALRLFIFALISQVPYSLAFSKKIINIHHLNIMFTMLFGILLLTVVNSLIEKFKDTDNRLWLVIVIILVFIAIPLSEFLNLSYNGYGILLILAFHLCRIPEEKYDDNCYLILDIIVKFVIMYYLTSTFYGPENVQMWSLVCLIPIFMHNHKKGAGLKYLFYIFYPAHLLILYFVYLGIS